MIGSADSKATTDSMPNDNEKDCNKSFTRDQATQTIIKLPRNTN